MSATAQTGIPKIPGPPIIARKTTFTLDRSKQVKRLNKDTVIDNFEITINANNENVNIQCNAGFYAIVAKPVMEDLAFGLSQTIEDITIKCHDITNRSDSTGAATTTVIMFRLHHKHVSTGQVTVHLHHTTRLVQVQGSALLPNGTRAPVWFVERVLRDKFVAQSKDQNYVITKFNKSVGDILSKSTHKVGAKPSCDGCQTSYSGRSAPVRCAECNLSYHKSKCYQSPNHPCYVKRRTVSCSTLIAGSASTVTTGRDLVPAIGQPQHLTSHSDNISNMPYDNQSLGGAPKPDPPTLQDYPGFDHNLLLPPPVPPPVVQQQQAMQETDVTADVSHGSPSSVPPTLQAAGASALPQSHPMPSTSSTSLQSLSQFMGTSSGFNPRTNSDMTSLGDQIQPYTGSSLGPSVPPFVSNSGTGDKIEHTKGKTKANKGNKTSNKTNNEIELEFSKYQNNVTQAKIRDQEVTIKDLRFKNNILESRVADLEGKQKQEIYDRYFPHPKDPQTRQEPVRNEGSSCCSSSPPTPVVISCCSGHHNTREGPGKGNITEFQDMAKKFEELKADLDSLKYRVDILSDVSIPKVIRQVLQSIAIPTHNTDAREGNDSLSTGDNNCSQQPPSLSQPDLNTSCMTVDDADISSQDLN